MLPAFISEYFSGRQDLLWILVVLIDLGMTLILYRLFGKMGLYAVVVLNIMLCNVVGPKITTVFGMTTSMGAIIYSGIYFATDLLGEKYGKREANRAVFIGFAVSVLLVVFGVISLVFQPVKDPAKAEFAWSIHNALATLFNFTPRFVFGSLLAYLISQTHDVWMFHRLKDLTQGRHLWLRNNLSTIVSQAIDTTVYGLVVWWAIFDLGTAIELALVKYVFKVFIALLDTPFIYWARTWNVEALDWNGPEGAA